MWLLKFSGVVWGIKNKEYSTINTVFQYFWNIINIIFLIIIAIFGFIELVIALIISPINLGYVGFSISLIFQSTTLLPTFFIISKKFNELPLLNEISVYKIDLKNKEFLIYVLFLTFSLTTSVLLMYWDTENNPLNIALEFFEISVCNILSLNLYLIIVDAVIIFNQLEKLENLVKEKSCELFDEYKLTKKIIDEKMSKHQLTTDLLVIGAIFNSLFIVIYFLFYSRGGSVMQALGFNSMFFKEIIFVIIIFLYLYLLNQKSDKITKLLAEDCWSSELGNDHIRINTLGHAIVSPISIYLLGYRLSREEVFYEIGSFILVLFISIIRTLIINLSE